MFSVFLNLFTFQYLKITVVRIIVLFGTCFRVLKIYRCKTALLSKALQSLSEPSKTFPMHYKAFQNTLHSPTLSKVVQSSPKFSKPYQALYTVPSDVTSTGNAAKCLGSVSSSRERKFEKFTDILT